MSCDLRTQLEAFFKKYGSSNTFVAKHISVSESLINHFRKGKRNIGERNAIKLKEFMDAR